MGSRYKDSQRWQKIFFLQEQNLYCNKEALGTALDSTVTYPKEQVGRFRELQDQTRRSSSLINTLRPRSHQSSTECKALNAEDSCLPSLPRWPVQLQAIPSTGSVPQVKQILQHCRGGKNLELSVVVKMSGHLRPDNNSITSQ